MASAGGRGTPAGARKDTSPTQQVDPTRDPDFLRQRINSSRRRRSERGGRKCTFAARSPTT
jgi:hypothetical protein